MTPTAPDGRADIGPDVLPAAVLWDMDGTLVDTEPYWIAAERDLVEEYGNEWPDHHAHALVGSDLLDAAEYIRHHGGVPLEPEEIVERLLDGVIARMHRDIPWRPGARELLADLHEAGVPCALVTMSWRRFVDPVVAALPDGAFVTTVTGDEVPVGEGKPHPTPYLLGAEACGARPEECLAIEDSPTGVRSALGAGCRVLAVPNVRDLDWAPGVTLVGSLTDVRLDDLPLLFHPDHPDHPVHAPPPGRSPFGGLRELRVNRRAFATLIVALVVATVAGVVLASGGEDEPALPPGAVAIDVWAPYWTLGETVPELDARLGELREISPFWYGARGVDEIVVDENSPGELTQAFSERAAANGQTVVPSIRDQTEAGEMAAILADPTTRRRHVEAVMTFARDLDADGIDLDYEQFAFADGRSTWETTRPHWVAFVEELAAELHDEGMTLTVSIPGVWNVTEGGSDGYWVYDHGAIAEHADRIRIMAYDYSVAEPGPIAPLPWVQDVVDGTSAVVAEEHLDKLVLGVPSYGANWVVSTLGECPSFAEGRTGVTARSVDDLVERRDAVPAFDPVISEWSFTYALTVESGEVSCVQNREVRWVDADGVADRVEVARRANWGGVALWALGYEDDEVFATLVSASRQPLEP